MSHSHPSASMPVSAAPHPGRVTRPSTWQWRPDTGSEVAVLLTGCRAVAPDDVVAAVRGYRTLLPRAGLYLYGHDLPAALCRAADAAGVMVRQAAPGGGSAAVRRMFAEVDADIYILADGANPDDVCLAPLILAEIDQRGCDLVDVSRFAEAPGPDVGDRLLASALNFLFGGGGETLSSASKACSRRFAVSYRAAGAGRDRPPALDLALHALRMRLPIGSVAALSGRPAASAVRGIADWLSLTALIAGLLVEQRPRRVLGLVGLAVMASGIAVALPALTIQGWRATLPLCSSTVLALLLVGCGGLSGVAGAALDTLTSARQEVARVGVCAIPRRADRSGSQSSVS